MNRSSDFDELFRRVLKAKIGELGFRGQSRIARKAGIAPQEINGILKGRRYGSERVKRAIAAAFGYERLDDFIDLGREKERPPKAVEVREPITPYRSKKENDASLSAARKILLSDTLLSEALRGVIKAMEEALRLLEERQTEKKRK